MPGTCPKHGAFSGKVCTFCIRVDQVAGSDVPYVMESSSKPFSGIITMATGCAEHGPSSRRHTCISCIKVDLEKNSLDQTNVLSLMHSDFANTSDSCIERNYFPGGVYYYIHINDSFGA